MPKRDTELNADPLEGRRIAPPEASDAQEPGVEKSAIGKRFAVVLAACLAVLVVASCVAFGVYRMGAQPLDGLEGNIAAQNIVAASSDAQPQDQQTSQGDAQVAAAPGASGNVGGSATQPAQESSEGSTSSSGGAASTGVAGGTSAGASSAPQAPQGSDVPAPKPSTITVHVYIDSSRAPGYPACMASTTVTLPAGSSVYDALCATGVSVGGGSSYVSSINGLSEKLPGYEGGSGWMYSVDGSFPNKPCGRYRLSGGEDIYWAYTLDIGNDL